MNDKNSILSHKLFLQREYLTPHLGYDREMDFYNAVKQGDFDRINRIMLPLKNEGLGKLSSNPLRNLKYHLIVTIAMITRFCIEGGLPYETAYTLSDIYIQQVDVCPNEEQINLVHREIVFDFASRMKNIQKTPGLSKIPIQISDYIYDHLQEKITLDQIAKAVNCNKTYMCELFKKETGKTVMEYVNSLRIEAAENMLMYADYPSTEISNYFMFSSHSHFIKVFKKYTGMTPKEYKKTHYRTNWIDPTNSPLLHMEK